MPNARFATLMIFRTDFPAPPEPLLYGLPVSLKDCFDLAGFLTTVGSRFYAERNAPAAKTPRSPRASGRKARVIVGKTNMHPLAYGITGENPDYGDCTQPRDPAS